MVYSSKEKGEVVISISEQCSAEDASVSRRVAQGGSCSVTSEQHDLQTLSVAVGFHYLRQFLLAKLSNQRSELQLCKYQLLQGGLTGFWR